MIRDILAILGFLLLCGGCYWHYPPLGAIVGGAVLMAFGILSFIISRAAEKPNKT